MNTTTTADPSPVLPLIGVLTSTLVKVQNGFHSIPGSPILIRYIKSSYQASLGNSRLHRTEYDF
jgi:serine palmitoyltransferase